MYTWVIANINGNSANMDITTGSINGIVDTQLSLNQFNSMSAISLISQRLLERSKEDGADEAVNFERPEILRATRRISKMLGFKEKISDSVSAVTKAKDAINWTKTYLTRAKTDRNTIVGSSSRRSWLCLCERGHTHTPYF